MSHLHRALDSVEDFKALYEAEFRMRDPNDPLWKLAEEYYSRCDTYDDAVCTGRSKYGSVPATNEEFRLINRHALKVLKEVRLKAEMAGFTYEALRDAMREYQRIDDKRR